MHALTTYATADTAVIVHGNGPALFAIRAALARVRQAVKDVATDMDASETERTLLDMLRSLDTATTFLGFAERKLARGE